MTLAELKSEVEQSVKLKFTDYDNSGNPFIYGYTSSDETLILSITDDSKFRVVGYVKKIGESLMDNPPMFVLSWGRPSVVFDTVSDLLGFIGTEYPEDVK